MLYKIQFVYIILCNNPIITTFGMLLNQIFEIPRERNNIPLIAISILILKQENFGYIDVGDKWMLVTLCW